MASLRKLIDGAASIVGNDSKLAAHLHVNRSAVTNWKKGISLPTFQHHAQLGALVGMSEADALSAAMRLRASRDKAKRLR